MRKLLGGALAAFGIVSGTCAVAEPAITGEYVEARTCSVYTGACHANGERVTAGREALMAWSFRTGTVQGVNLEGVKVLAVTAGADNLAQPGATRKSVLYVDAKATADQAAAAARLIEQKYGKTLGEVASVKRAPVEFKKADKEYTIRVPEIAYLKTTRYDCSHCVMPHLVWYDPFVNLKSSIVAKAAVNEYKGSAELGTKWRRADENSSFVGEFAF